MKNKISYSKYNLAFLLATYFNIGNIKYAPGTFGSIATFPLFLVINFLFLKLGISSLCQLTILYLLTLVFLFYIGFWSTKLYISQNKKHDPSEVVIDEVIGQMIAYMIPTIFTIYYFMNVINYVAFDSFISIMINFIIILGPFLFFRVFDISKIGLVGYFDKKTNGGALNIIMDDVVAGVYAGIAVCVILAMLFFIVSCY